MITLLYLVIVGAFAQDLQPFPQVVTDMAAEFFTRFNERQPGMNNYRPMLANVVRLAFHSCAGSTGCCGYVNLNEPDNAGLDLSVDYLEGFMPDWTAAGFSRADLYAFASEIAAGMSLGDSFQTILQTVELDRTDCESLPEVGEVVFPSAHDSPFAYFEQHFGFSTRETVAIMGAHNIGRALEENSGFDGFWVNNPLTLNSEFYERILDNPWSQEEAAVVNGVQLHAWEQNNRIALNSDMFLIRNFETNAGRVVMNNCRNNFNQCQDAETEADAIFFRDNDELFQQEFRAVYTKMMRSAGDGLEQELTPLCERFDCSAVADVEAPVMDQQDSSDSSEEEVEEDAEGQEDAESDSSDSSDSNDGPGNGPNGPGNGPNGPGNGGPGNGGGRGGRPGRGGRGRGGRGGRGRLL